MTDKVLTTSKGKAIFPHLIEADTMFQTEGLFHVKLECPKVESKNIISVIKNGIAQEVKKQHDVNPNKAITHAPLPYEETDETVTFKFKSYSEVDQNLSCYDANATEVDYPNKMYGLIAQEVKVYPALEVFEKFQKKVD